MKWTVLAIIATSFIRSGFTTPIFTSPTHPIVLADRDPSLSGNRTPDRGGPSHLPLLSAREITVPSNQSPIAGQVQESVSPPQDVAAQVVTRPKARHCNFIGLLKKFCGFPTSPAGDHDLHPPSAVFLDYLQPKSSAELREIIKLVSQLAYTSDNQTDDAINAHILLIYAMRVLFKRMERGEPIRAGDRESLAEFNEHFNYHWLELYNKQVFNHWVPLKNFFNNCQSVWT
ncbi:hypothetical protein H0H93_001654 [Arthromyces matolae]|nr:hypothetical protein H0H93_001654 [Arthromyces matolae]